MTAFYRGVFLHKNGDRAMCMLNDIVDPEKTTFGIYNCEKLFVDVWNGYLEETAKPGVAEAIAAPFLHDRSLPGERGAF